MTPVLAAGTRLGRYEIRSQLGSGGMGEVYLARDKELERMVAVKVLSVEAASDRERMNRFIQEAKAASALNHPNIITIYEVSRGTPVRFIVTEFIEGQTLRQRMAGPPPKAIEILEITIQVASALAAAHAAGIVHRDIKPENIMLRSDGYVKVLDFGLAKLTEQHKLLMDGQAATIQMLTKPGVVLGTIYYMSPEQARALPLDGRTDVWSLGVVLYEMVSGSLPFQGATATDVIVSIVEREPLSLTSRSREIPAELQRIIKKAIRKDRALRYQTIAEMLVDLRSLKQELEFEGRSRGVVSTDSDKSLKLLETTEVAPANTDAVATTRTESQPPNKISQIRSHKGKLMAILAITSLLVVVVLKWPLSSKPTESAITSPSPSTAGLTTKTDVDDAKPFDQVAVKKEINDFLQGWAASFANHDLDAHMSCYAETLDIYNDRTNVSAGQVRAERLGELEQYSEISLELPRIRITLDSGSRAIAIFDKTWGFRGNKSFTGSARQEVWLTKLNGRWRITGEKTLQIYDEVRQK